MRWLRARSCRVARAATLVLALGWHVGGCGGGSAPPPAPLAKIVVPTSYDSAHATPLVVFLHPYGYGSSDILADCDDWLQLAAAAESRGVLLALPLGGIDSRGARYWNGAGCCDFYGEDPDHVTFLERVIADVEQRYNVDPKRVFLLGHSSGGFMAHRLGCEASDVVAAFVTIAGDVWKDGARCAPENPVSVLQVHGDADAIIPYAGGEQTVFDVTLDLPSARASLETWAAIDGCTGPLTDTNTRLDLDASIAGAETTVERYECVAGAAELWTMQGSGHAPQFRVPFSTEAMVDWLLAHPKP